MLPSPSRSNTRGPVAPNSSTNLMPPKFGKFARFPVTAVAPDFDPFQNRTGISSIVTEEFSPEVKADFIASMNSSVSSFSGSIRVRQDRSAEIQIAYVYPVSWVMMSPV